MSLSLYSPKISQRFAPALLSLAVTGLLASNTAIAQTDNAPSADSITVLPEVIVTASAVPLAADEVGSSVSVITADEIEQRQINRVTDALRLLPGVNITTTGPNGSGSVFVRGHSSSDVLILVDGVRMNDPSTIGNGIDISLLSMNNVERIEFIKGAQSAVWGSGAVGGVINILTKKDVEDGVTFNAFTEVGSRDFYQLGGGLTAKQDGHSAILNFTGKQFDGISSAASGSEEDPFRENSASLRFNSEFTDNWRASFGFRHQNSETKYDENPFDSLPIDLGNYSSSEIQAFDFNTTYNANSLTHKFYANHSTTDRFNHLEPFGDTSDPLSASREKEENTEFKGSNSTLGYQGSLLFGRTDNQALTLTIEENTQRINSSSGFAPAKAESDTYEYGLELNLAPTDSTNLSFATRYQENDIFDGDVTFRVSASQDVGAGGRLHLSAGNSVRNPSLTQLFAPSSGNIDLMPQKSESYDIGYEQSLFDDQVVLDTTFFYSEVDDLFGFNPSNFQTINTPGETRRQGFEISAKANLGDDLSANASYTYLDAETDAGTQEIRRPKNSLDLGLTYQINQKWSIGSDVQVRGGNVDSDFRTFPSTTVDLDDYALWTLRSSYQVNDNFEVYGRVDNVLDEDYQQVLGYGTLGTSAYAGLRVNF